jgi:DNA-binding XRE family transcriptional regulator
MPKDPDSPILPHLKPDELEDRDHEELKLDRQLAACWSGDDFDVERSYNVMQGFAERIFDVMYAAFRKRSGYKDEWVSEIVSLAAFRTITTSLGHIQNGIRKLSLSALSETLEETVRNHLEELENSREPAVPAPPLALTGKQAAAYARAGIDMASASPLLLMAHAAAQESARRGGTTPLTAPKRRIPRSIHSESAAKKLENYLNTKGLTQTEFAIQINVNTKTLYRFRTTGNVGKSVAQVIARAMGVTLEEFISL